MATTSYNMQGTDHLDVGTASDSEDSKVRRNTRLVPIGFRLRQRTTAFVSMVIGIAVIASMVAGGSRATAQTGDAGYRGHSFGWSVAPGADPNIGPTSSKPQSKLWFNDGLWWGILYDAVSTDFHIYRLDWQTQHWIDTGVLVDERRTSHADALWDGTNLYVATAGPDSANTGHSARFLRYSYNAATKSYAVDSGFPVTITTGGVEAVVVAKDSTGKFWVTSTQGSRVFVNRSLDNASTWGVPFVLPVNGTTVSADDLSAIIAFKSKIGVMWSNQIDETMYFATHRDGDPDDSWGPSVPAYRGPKFADDHINLKELKSDASGEVFAVIKTGRGDLSPNNPSDPQIVVLSLQGNALWGPAAVFGTVQENHTRPILMIDEQNRELYVFASSNSGEPPSAIVYKKTSLDKIAFPPGPGTPFIQLATDTNINNATSTKQNVTNATGLVVVASDITTGYYGHNAISLGQPAPTATPSPTNPPPTATPSPTSALPTPTSAPTASSAYSSAVLGTGGLVSYWRLNEQTGTTAADAVGGNTGTLNNVTLGAAGALSGDTGTAMTFDGKGSYVAIPGAANLNLTGDLTLEAWVKPSVVDATSRTVLAKASADGSFTGRQFRLGMSEGRWRGTLYNTAGGTYSAIAATAPVAGTWQHVVATVTGTTIRVYVNGVEAGTGTFSGTRTSVTSGTAIGRLGDNASQYFGGTVDEVAVYNTALSAAQVLQHYNAGTSVTTATPSPTNAPATTPTATTAPATQSTYSSAVLGTGGLVSYWRLNEQTGTTAADAVGGNTGTLNNVTLGAAGALSGDTGTAMTFDGKGSYVAIPGAANLNLTGDLTLEAWVKPSVVDATSRTVLAKASADGSFTGRQFRLGMSEGRWRGTLYNTAGGTYSAIAATAPVAGTWQHVVATVTGTTIRVYVNGVEAGTGTFSGTRTSVTSGTAIGRLGDNASQYFGGTVDEVAVYNTALTATQILQHYNAGIGAQ